MAQRALLWHISRGVSSLNDLAVKGVEYLHGILPTIAGDAKQARVNTHKNNTATQIMVLKQDMLLDELINFTSVSNEENLIKRRAELHARLVSLQREIQANADTEAESAAPI